VDIRGINMSEEKNEDVPEEVEAPEVVVAMDSYSEIKPESSSDENK